MRGRKTLIAAGSVAGAALGGAIDPDAILPMGIVVGLLAWLLTSTAKEPAPAPPPPVAAAAPPRPERSARAEQAELEHLRYAAEVVTEAVLRGLVDQGTADRLRAVIEERRHRAMGTALAPLAGSRAPVPAPPPASIPGPAPVTVREPVPPPAPTETLSRVRRIKEVIVSDVAVHGLAYLGVLLLFAGAFGFTLFSFGSVRVGLRPVAEIGMPGMLLGSAWFLRRRGAPVVATGLGVIGGLLLPVMLFASFVDGVAFPPEVHGTALALTLAAVAAALAAAYAAYTVRQPDASVRYLVAPMVWFACWAGGLLLAGGAGAGIDLRRWSAGQLAFVSVGVAATGGRSPAVARVPFLRADPDLLGVRTRHRLCPGHRPRGRPGRGDLRCDRGRPGDASCDRVAGRARDRARSDRPSASRRPGYHGLGPRALSGIRDGWGRHRVLVPRAARVGGGPPPRTGRRASPAWPWPAVWRSQDSRPRRPATSILTPAPCCWRSSQHRPLPAPAWRPGP